MDLDGKGRVGPFPLTEASLIIAILGIEIAALNVIRGYGGA